MMTRPHARLLSIGLTVLGAMLMACAPQAGGGAAGAPTPEAFVTPTPRTVVTEKPRYGGLLRIAKSEDPQAIEGHIGRGGGDHTHIRAIANHLIAADDGRRLDPGNSLASKWEILDDTTIRLTLRDNILFHDGTKFDASAVKWNIERVLDPKNVSPGRGSFLVIKQVEVKDPLTVVLHLTEPNAPILFQFADRQGIMHSPASVAKWGEDHGFKYSSGTGPFEYVEWVKDSHVTVRRNKSYWKKDESGGQLPYLDEIRWQILSESRVRIAALETKQVDLMDPGSFPGDFIGRVKDKPGFVFFMTKGASTPDFRLNLDVFPMNNVNLRRAISYSLDRRALMKVAYGELGEYIGGGPMTPAFEQFFVPPDKGGVPPVERDLNKAREELKLGGYPNGFEWTIVTSTSEVNRRRVEAAQSMQAEVGIIMKPEILDDLHVQRRMYADRDAASFPGSFSDRYDPDGSIFEKYYCAPEGSGLVVGFGSYMATRKNCVVEASKALLEARRTYDLEKRKQLYLQFDKLFAEHVLGLMHGYLKRGIGYWDHVQGFVLGGDQKGEYYKTWLKQ
ncbi:MAG: ABC transporter substrate-binding protein [Chloroflexi bacterium]|nr:ABC transporter substrate-binding protein [Chloroflexota bacterium]